MNQSGATDHQADAWTPAVAMATVGYDSFIRRPSAAAGLVVVEFEDHVLSHLNIKAALYNVACD